MRPGPRLSQDAVRTGNSTLEASSAAPGPRPKPYTSQSPLPSRSVNRDDPFEGRVCNSGSIPGQSQDLGVAPRPWPCDLGRVPSPLGARSSSFGMTLPCSPWQPPRGQTQAASEVSSVSTAAVAAQATARQAPPAVGPWEPRPQRRPRPLASPCPAFPLRGGRQERPPGPPARVSPKSCEFAWVQVPYAPLAAGPALWSAPWGPESPLPPTARPGSHPMGPAPSRRSAFPTTGHREGTQSGPPRQTPPQPPWTRRVQDRTGHVPAPTATLHPSSPRSPLPRLPTLRKHAPGRPPQAATPSTEASGLLVEATPVLPGLLSPT